MPACVFLHTVNSAVVWAERTPAPVTARTPAPAPVTPGEGTVPVC